MESETLNEQINSLISEYAESMKNLKANSTKSVDTTALKSEIDTLKSELEKTEENLKWITISLENAKKDMEDRNMGAIPNDPFFENNNKAKEECEQKINDLKSRIEEKESELKNTIDEKNPEMERVNELSQKIKKMIEFQKKNLEDSLASIERVKSEMIEKAENGFDPTDREIAKMFIKDNSKKIRELKEKIESCDKLLERVESIESSLKENKGLDFEKMKEYYEFFNNYNKEPIGQDDIEVNVTFDKDTDRYTVNCKSGNFELNPGKEFTEEEFTKENVNRLLKGFAGAVSNNKVLVNANGKRYSGARVNNAAESIINAAKDMNINKDKNINKNNTNPNPNLGGNNNKSQNNDENKKEQTVDAVVNKVIKTRNFKIGGVSLTAGLGAATALAIAAVPALGIPLAAISAAAAGLTTGSVTSLITNAAANHKSSKIRKSLSKLAQKYDLVVKVDKETKSVYFCSTDDLSTRISLEDLNNPNPDVRATAQALQAELDEMFKNNERGTASKEAMEKYAKSGFLTASVPLEYCQKVTLDNLEAAYQEVGGVYALHNEDKKSINIGKKTITTPFLDPNKVSANFAQSIEPEKKTQSESVDMEDVVNFVEEQANPDNAEQEEKNKNKEQTASQENHEGTQQGGDTEPTQEEAELQPESPSQGQSTDNDDVYENTTSSKATQDVDTIDDAQTLANALDDFMAGLDVSQTIGNNSQNIHDANTYANMMGDLNGEDLSEGKGMSK